MLKQIADNLIKIIDIVDYKTFPFYNVVEHI